jgi:hypothetical protein
MPLSALALAALAALVVLGAAWQGAGTMRQALRR